MWDELIINGYRFGTMDEYKEAKKEEEAIKYIKLKTNFKSYENVQKLYETLLEKKTLHTVIGLDFLHDLYKYLDANKTTEDIAPIPLDDIKIKNSKAINIGDNENIKEKKLSNLVNLYKSRNKNKKIVIFFLIVLLIGLFVLTFTGKNSPLIDDEMRLQDKYSAWEEDLTRREEQLRNSNK